MDRLQVVEMDWNNQKHTTKLSEASVEADNYNDFVHGKLWDKYYATF